MVQYVLLDNEIAGAFAGLYQGNITEAVREERFSFGAVEDGKPVALFISTLFEDYTAIKWIYVHKDYRNKEIGTRMLNGGIRVLQEIFGYDIVNVSTEDPELKKFLEGCGFVFSDNRHFASYRSKLNSIIKLPEVKIPENTVFSLSELDPETFDLISFYFETLKDTEIPITLPIKKEDYLDIPAVCIEKNIIRSVLLLKKEAGQEVSIAFAYAFNQDGRALAMLIQEAKKAITERFGDDLYITTSSLGDNTERMMDRLFAKSEKKTIYCGTYLA